MSNWKIHYSFAVFYRAVYPDNCHLPQYEIVSILIDGQRLNMNPNAPRNANGSDVANHYVTGRRPINRAKVSALDSISEKEIVRRIAATGIFDPLAAVRCLRTLIDEDHLMIHEMGLATSALSETDPLKCLAKMFLLSVHCPRGHVSTLTNEMIEDISKCRMPQQDNSSLLALSEETRTDTNAAVSASSVIPTAGTLEATEATGPEIMETSNAFQPDSRTGHVTSEQPAFVYPSVFSAYSFRELHYETDRDEYRFQLLRMNMENPVMSLSERSIVHSTDIFRRADRTFIVDFSGTALGLAEMLFHHISSKQCSQLLLIVRMGSEKDMRVLQPVLVEIIEHALAADGYVFLSTGLVGHLSNGIFDIRIVYSVNSISDNTAKLLNLLDDHPTREHLGNGKLYQNRVPDLLLPDAFNPNSDLYYLRRSTSDEASAQG